MKIYNRLVYDLKSGNITEEAFFEYEGIVAECKGGGGSSTTSVDKAYNKRMAAIAEAQQGMAEEYFNYYKYGRGHYAMIDDPIPRPDTSFEKWQETPGKERDYMSHAEWKKAREDEWTKANTSRTWIPDEGAVGLQQYEQEQMKSAMKLLPGQTALAERHMGLTGKYFDEISKGADVRGEMGRAKADVQQAYSGMEGEWRREAGRTGISPASGRFAGMRSRMLRDKTKTLAGVGTTARRYAEEKQFERLRGAVQ